MTPVTATLQSPIHLAELITREQRECFYDRIGSSGETCWLWRAYRDREGYGKYSIGLRWNRTLFKVPAHRLAWALVHPDVDLSAADCVLHSCDNPPCCRPDHLFLGTRLDNTRDMVMKGRNSRVCKLAPDDVHIIRASRQPRKQLAARFDIALSQVYKIQYREAWAWLEENDLEALFGDN